MKRTMKMPAFLGLVFLAAMACWVVAQEQPLTNTARAVSPPQSRHLVVSPESVEWKAVGIGTEFAVLSGSPDAEGAPFVIRLRFADQVHIAPHWHPVDEHITVIAGTFYMGMGEKFNESMMKEMPAGSYGFMPKETRHFGWAKGTTTIQIHGIGPFKTNWVDPAGTPTKN